MPLNTIKINGEDIDYDFEEINAEGGKAFLDSGTTFVYFDFELFTKFKHSISKFCRENKDNCAGNSSYQECFYWNKKKFATKKLFLESFPVIDFDLGGSVLNWYPNDYMVEPLDGTSHLCIGVK